MSKVIHICLVGAGLSLICAGFLAQEHRADADPWRDAPKHITVRSLSVLPDVSSIIRRDPFAAPVEAGDLPGNLPEPQDGPNIPRFDGGSLPQLVPNPGGAFSGMASVVGGGDVTVVGTVISGDQPPMALVRVGGQTQVVGIGDVIGGRRIKAIVSQGIVFQDGTRLAVDNGAKAVPQTDNATVRTMATPMLEPVQNSPHFPTGGPVGIPVPVAPTTSSASINNQGLTPDQFGPAPSPSPGATFAPLPRLYTPPPGTPGLPE